MEKKAFDLLLKKFNAYPQADKIQRVCDSRFLTVRSKIFRNK